MLCYPTAEVMNAHRKFRSINRPAKKSLRNARGFIAAQSESIHIKSSNL